MRDFLLIAVVIVCSFVALGRPVVGILAFIGLGILNLNTMTWTLGRGFPFAQVIAVSTIIGYFFGPESKKFPRQRESVFLAALWCMFGLSTLLAIYPERAFERFIHISKIILMVFLSTSIINTEHRLSLMVRVIAFSLGFYGLKGGLFVLVTGGNYMVHGPGESFIGANNAIGLALAMNIPLLFYLSKVEPRTWLRLIMRFMILFSYPAVICTFSRGAWLGLAAVSIFLLLKNRYKFLLLPAAVIVGLMILPYIPQHLPQRVIDRYGDLAGYQEEKSAQSRLWNWEFATRVALANPLHGGGFDYYSQETYAAYFPEFLQYWPGKVWSSHSIWFTIFGEHGVPGIIIWIGLIVSCFFSLRQMRSYARQMNMSGHINYVDMLQTALVAYLVVGTFYDAAYFDMFYYLVAVIIILKEKIYRSGLGVGLTGNDRYFVGPGKSLSCS